MPNLAQSWKLWRYVALEDTAPTTGKPSALSKPRGEHGSDGVITVRGYDNIMIMAFGTDAENETFTLVFEAWAENGPGTHVLTVTGILGASNFTESFLPEDGAIPTTTKFYLPDDNYTLSPNLIGASEPTMGTQLTGMLSTWIKIPVLGFSYMRLYVRDIRGGGVEAATIGVIWKPMDVARGTW